MKEGTIHPKEGLQLRQIGKQYMIVEACKENVNVSDVYSLNHTAASLWKLINLRNYSLEELADYLCETYDTDKATAIQDVERQLSEWKSYGLIL